MEFEVPKVLFKYLSPKNGIDYVLDGGTIKWSNPFEFNDPFDNQYNLQLEEYRDELIDELFEIFLTQDFSSIFIRKGNFLMDGKDFTDALRAMRTSMTKEQSDYIKEGVREGIDRFRSTFPQFNDEFKEQMKENAIFCLTDTPDDEAMWAYYAANNTGIVVGFSTVDAASVLPLARPVRYANSIPKLTYSEFFSNFSDQRKLIKKQVEQFTLTKSARWSHEKEWRIVIAGGAGIRPFLLEELREIYMGYKISPEDREKVMEIAQRKYPWAKLFQATPKQNEFGFDFESVKSN